MSKPRRRYPPSEQDVDVDAAELTVAEPEDHAAGVKAVAVSMRRSLHHMGPIRTSQTLVKLNQPDGFDCMSCAWPDPDPGHRHKAEFCENGAKAVAEEATTARATPGILRRRTASPTSTPGSPNTGSASRGGSPIRW